ncbi:uncharacterized protein LOC129608355 [Condylostylus longicornis]|uniref:uncharacterized protein LOC129608355 n=1 Tax=Condylostylus longicornis TaxID=2530218 RepID=UPI00244E58F6|nr:uncharacterized protein LOC129608355 [Condylostylus longicornis]XP_055375808.1 uncharacterized protein LOC129608355 [Condylostylus longicornis]
MKFNSNGFILSLIILSILFDYVNSLKCFQCDSTKERNCVLDPENSEEIKTCTHLCAMSVDGQVTYRGCSGEIPRGQYYTECGSTLCNSKIIPNGRLKCFQCEGKECIQEQNDKALPCVTFLEEDFCYTDILNATYALRGCKSDNKTLSSNAVECSSRACNNENGIQKRVCSQCDDEKTGCKRLFPNKDPLKCFIDETLISNCTVEYLFGHPNETCFVYHRLNKVERGCTKLRPDISNDKEHFLTCDGDKCNNKCLNATKCVACDSSDDPNCKNNPVDTKLKLCGPEESSCYTKIVNPSKGIIKRDCGAPFDLNYTNLCQGDGCNNREIQKCYNCSSKTDPNCSKWVNSNGIVNEICETSNDECLIAITADQHTVRGCKSQNLYCNETEVNTCKSCAGPLCNSGLFPDTRLKCYQCRDSDVCNRDQRSNGIPTACTNFTSDDECIEFIDEKQTNIIRGCKSDFSLFEICKNQTDKCVQCNSEGCNYHKIFEKPKLSCFTCDSTQAPKGACAWKQKNDTLTKCNQNVYFYNQETCFTHIKENGETIRGCSLDFNVPNLCSTKNNENGCQICHTEGCNYINTINQSCVQCKSNITGMENCKKKAEGLKPTICKNPNQYFEKRGCFTKAISKDVVERGCSFDLTDVDFEECLKADNKNCNYCEGDNCNMFEAPDFFGSSSKPSITVWLLSFIIGVALHLN